MIPFDPHKELLRCLIHGQASDHLIIQKGVSMGITTSLDDGGTGCSCRYVEPPEEAQDTPHYVEIETPPIVKNPKPFCTKCGRSHKAQWCHK